VRLLDLVRGTKPATAAQLREALEAANAERTEAAAALDRLQQRRAELLVDGSERDLDAVEADIRTAQRGLDRLDLVTIQAQEKLREAEEMERRAELDRRHAEGEKALERGLAIYARHWPKHAAALRELAFELMDLESRIEAVNAELVKAGDPRRVAGIDPTARPSPPNSAQRGPGLVQALRLPSTVDSTKMVYPATDCWGTPYPEREFPGR
jgi:hypothetical protein